MNSPQKTLDKYNETYGTNHTLDETVISEPGWWGVIVVIGLTILVWSFILLW